MKRIRLYALFLTLFVAMACDSQPLKPKAPTDETLHKNHDDPYYMELHLTAGGEENLVHKLSQAANWASEQPLKVKANVKYLLKIKYFDKNKKEITGQFATNGEEKIHQHFFLEDPRVTKVGIQKFINYQYADTQPWDKSIEEGATLIGEKNPIGLKGDISFLQSGSKFRLWIALLHDTSGDKRLKKGGFAQWHKIPREKAFLGWDINVYIPVIVE